MRPIKCIFVNVNSIVSRHRRHYLNLFTNEHRPDVLMLAEHGLNSRHNFGLSGYRTFRQDRIDRGGGGTAVLVRETIDCNDFRLDLGAVENTAVRIRLAGGNSLIVLSMYMAPRAAWNVADLAPLLDLSAGGPLLIGGDLNAKHPDWGGTVCNGRGRLLRDFLLTCPNLRLHSTDGPTRISGDSRTYIDIAMTTPDIEIMMESEGLRTLDYESDHRAVEISLSTEEFLRCEPRTIYDYHKIDRQRFNQILTQTLPGLTLPIDRTVTPAEIDYCIDGLTNTFGRAIGESVPRIPLTKRGLLRLPSRILELIDTKKRLRRTLYRTEDMTRIPILRADIRNLDRIIQGSISEFEKAHWTNFLEDIKMDHMTFGKVKRAAGVRRHTTIPALHGPNGDIVTDKLDMTNLLADHFGGLTVGPRDGSSSSMRDSVVNGVASLVDYSPTIQFCPSLRADGTGGSVSSTRECGLLTSADIGEAIRGRRGKKSAGPDGIPGILLRKADSCVWYTLAVIFNHCFNIGYFPMAWRRALVVPIPKNGCGSGGVEDYRPISLLSSLGKLMEHFILRKIRHKMDDLGVLRDCQFGFRRGHSTTHALMVLTDYITKGLRRRCPTIAVSLDFSRAFDLVWQDAIIYKMMSMNFGRELCRITADFLRKRTFRVKLDDSLSNIRPVLAGVPQGSLLGPTLYNIFLSDIPPPPTGDLILIYADDILIAASGPRARSVNARLRDYLNRLFDFFCKWDMKLNMDKTNAIIFKGRRRGLYPNCRQFVPSLDIGGELIRTKDRIKYLGVIFHESFRFYRHIDYTLDKVRKTYFSYCSLLRRRGGLDRRIRLLVYRQIVRPLMAYAFPIWFGISSHQMERLRVWERRIVSACLGLGPRMVPDGSFRRPSCSAIYMNMGFERIDLFLMRSAISFLGLARQLPNELVRNCLTNTSDLESVRRHEFYAPLDILTLKDAGLLYRNDRLVFYHRRFNSLDWDNLVYNTSQW